MVKEPVATLAYENAEGVIVHIPFCGKNVRQVTMDAQYARIQNKLRKVDTYLQERHEVCSWVTCEEMRKACIELAKSDDAMLFDGKRYINITIMDINFVDEIPWRKPQPFKISYILQDKDARDFEG